MVCVTCFAVVLVLSITRHPSLGPFHLTLSLSLSLRFSTRRCRLRQLSGRGSRQNAANWFVPAPSVRRHRCRSRATEKETIKSCSEIIYTRRVNPQRHHTRARARSRQSTLTSRSPRASDEQVTSNVLLLF